MRIRWKSSLAALVLGNSLGWAQTPAPADSQPPAYYDGPPPSATVTDGPYHPISNTAVDVRPASLPAPEATTPGPGPGPANPVWTEVGCGRDADRLWVQAEYLLWWMTDNRIPVVVGALPAALATVNPADLPTGAITPLFSGDNLNFGSTSGIRFTVGGWIDEDQHIGLEGSSFVLDRRTINFTALGNGDPVVGPVFTDVTNGRETIITPVEPLQARELAHVSVSERLWSAEANVRSRLAYFGRSPLEVFAGFRYLDLDDRLSIFTSTDFLGIGTSSQADIFQTRNRFYGGQIGASFDLNERRWSLTMQGKLALGGMSEAVDIRGSTVDVFNGAAPQAFVGGVLAQQGNIGHFTHSQFVAMPELTVNLGYQVTRLFRVFVGYNLLYISDAVRPGQVIDVVNPRFIHDLIVTNPVNINRPVPQFESTDLWVQGLNFGLEFRY
jgi:hypothetical protein